MKLSLKYLILFVALLSVALTMFSSISSGYRVNQASLVNNTLETNRVYAQKIAYTTDNFLETTLQTLAYSAKEVKGYMGREDAASFLFKETERLFNQTSTFNSVVVTSAEGLVIAASPESLDIVGESVNSEGGKQALAKKKPLITKPFTSITGRLIVFISYPIFDDNNNYLGYIGGSIYLLEDNILNELLGEHFYQDGSYVYVVDEDGRIIYHPEKDRIDEVVIGNPVIDAVVKGNSGSRRLVNSAETDMLAGYAYMPTMKWGVVSQRPTEAALLPSKNMRNEMILIAMPFLLLSFLLIIYIANRIARPLEKLGYYAESSMDDDLDKKVEKVNAWYYEAIQLEKALIKSFSFFEDKVNYFIHQSTTDPLTGLVNRRSMNEQTQRWESSKIPYSIILFDIDHFKHINDTFGHSVGDEVLKFLALEMQDISRAEDVCCRYGGEEFILLLPHTAMREAFEVAERLRKKLESTISPSGEIITISSGIAASPECSVHILELIEIADKCLYEAKNTGRNKSIMASFREVMKG